MPDIPPFHGLEIISGSALYGGVPIPMREKEFLVLEILMRHDPHAVTFGDMLFRAPLKIALSFPCWYDA